jgi:hypothetical protein
MLARTSSGDGGPERRIPRTTFGVAFRRFVGRSATSAKPMFAEFEGKNAAFPQETFSPSRGLRFTG